ncbi:MAG TPA: hypothetical protein PL124_11205 [Candidatus Cloacimonadota bacterium]|nr:hypothetical protein [Candidatus Cloacimonadota bacterium]
MFQISGVSIVLLIVGLVELIKKFGVTGNKLTLISVLIGVLVGVGFKVYEMYPLAQSWIELAVVGLAYGLAATGLYDLSKNAVNVLHKE